MRKPNSKKKITESSELANSYTWLSETSLRSLLAPFGVSVTPQLAEQIRIYIELLLTWNRRISLTSVIDTRDIVTRHFGESFFGVQILRPLVGRLADFGSGAGFPALPIKMICPEISVSLIESDVRKCAFLSEVARKLELKSVKVLHERLESLRRGWIEVDLVTCRAVGSMLEVLSVAKETLAPNGRIALWLGSKDAKKASECPGWNWSNPALVPSSKHRVILVGRLK